VSFLMVLRTIQSIFLVSFFFFIPVHGIEEEKCVRNFFIGREDLVEIDISSDVPRVVRKFEGYEGGSVTGRRIHSFGRWLCVGDGKVVKYVIIFFFFFL